MYSVIASIIFNFIFGIFLTYEFILLYLFLWFLCSWGYWQEDYVVLIVKYNVFFLPLCILCV